ncbi:hypothetical protein [Pantoea agglomerans]|nr:hypothetical protein [Pantoea agglomerans]
MSKFIFSSPRKYVQGAGVLDELGPYVAELGDRLSETTAAHE